MTTKHTPGPWHVMGNGGDIHPEAVYAEGQGVILAVTLAITPEPIRKANAVLIAAAPDLLEAASAALIYVMALEQDSALERRLRKALAKAQPKATP